MRVSTGVRLSSTLTTSLACLSLGYAELVFIPGIWWLAVPTLFLLALAYFVEGRWALSVRAANIAGIFLSALTLGWFFAQILGDAEAARFPLFWASALVPHLGPLLMLLVLVKSYRPKDPSDYRMLQGMAFVEICLACVLGTGPVLGLCLLGYLASSLWGFALLNLDRQMRLDACVTARPPGPPIPWGLFGVARALRWTLLMLVLVPLFFLFTPRFGRGEWNPLQLLFSRNMSRNASAVTGASAEIDLNSSGTIDVDEEIALTVFVSQDAEGKVPKTDLPDVQRWRGSILDVYIQGRWQNRLQSRILPADRSTENRRPTVAPEEGVSFELFDLGPGTYYVTFQYNPRQAGGLFLAEPIYLPEGFRRVPVVPLKESTLFIPAHAQGTLLPVPRAAALRGEVSYRQATLSAGEDQIYPAVEISTEYTHELMSQPVLEIRQWTHALARELASRDNPVLSQDDRDRIVSEQGVARGRQVVVARAICDYFARSGEFSYTLDRPRNNTAIDPTLDFLRNVKAGHCERFATALALVLRSARIPARIVKGFRGADGHDDGTYDIRNSHAHAWVEALVWNQAADGNWYLGWQMLDPTPSGETVVAQDFSLARWLRERKRALESLWNDFIVNYDLSRQEDFFYDVTGLVKRKTLMSAASAGLLGITTLGLMAAGARWIRRRRQRFIGATALDGVYSRLLALLYGHFRLRPVVAQTPREFGLVAAGTLSGRFKPFADLPGRIVALLYRARFGARPLTDTERAALHQQLDRFAAALGGGKTQADGSIRNGKAPPESIH